MKKLFLLFLLPIAALAQTASVSLSTSSPGTTTVNLGSQPMGSLTIPVDITVTNNTGGSLTVYANYYVDPGSWPAGNGNFVQFNADGMAPTWAPSLSGANTCLTSAPGTLSSATIANGASCHVFGYLTPTSASSTGQIVFKNGAGTTLATVTINATGTTPAAAGPTAPTKFTAPWPSTAGYTVTTVSANLQTAIDAATCGTVLKLTHGTTFTTGSGFILRNKGCDATHQIILMSDDCNQSTGACSTLPSIGNRITAAQTASMATLSTTTSNPAILTECSASYYRIGAGIEIKQGSAALSPQQQLILQVPSVGGSCTPTTLPNHISLDRVYAHTFLGDSPEFTGGILELCSQYTSVQDSILYSDGASNEVQGISSTCNQAGPYRVINTQVTHSGENIFFGGGDGPFYGSPMSDLEIFQNYIYKPPTWNMNCSSIWTGTNPCAPTTWDSGNSPVAASLNGGTWAVGTTYSSGAVVYYGNTTCHYYVSRINGNVGITPGTDRTKWWCADRQVKNGLEFKKGHRAEVYGNIIDGDWVGAQDGSIVLFECANQSGMDLQACIRDMNFHHNLIRNAAYCFNQASSSYAYPSESEQRVSVTNNLCYGINKEKTGAIQSGIINNLGPSVSNTALSHNKIGGWNFFLEHNTLVGNSTINAIYTCDSGTCSVPAQTLGNFRYNLFDPEGTYGILIWGTSGDAQITKALASFNLPKNVIVGTASTGYSATNFVIPFPANDTAVRFANPTANDYRLCTGVGTPDASCVGASAYLNTAGDGLSYGADIDTINSYTTCVPTGACAGALTVSPATVTLPVSGTQQFSASQFGTTSFSWSAACGSISGTGSTATFTAPGSPSTCTITASGSGAPGTATATVQSVAVTPSTVPLQVNATQQFTSNFTSTWSASCGTISGSGLYTAPSTNGTCTITATAVNGGATGTATATVSGAVTNLPLTISPTSWNYGTVTISTNADKTFTLTNPGTGTDTITAKTISSGSSQYSIVSDTCGATLAGGANCTFVVRFNSSVAGTFSGNLNVTDSAGGIINVPLTATIAAGVNVSVSPTTATLPPSGVQPFTANVTVTWTASCGTITSAGIYTAPASANTCVVTATSGTGSTAQANVTVNALTVTPIAVTLQVNSKQQFTANFASSWAVTSGTCTITAAGLLTAPNTNTSCIVRATAQNGGSTATASVSVVGAPSSAPGTQARSLTLDAGTIR